MGPQKVRRMLGGGEGRCALTGPLTSCKYVVPRQLMALGRYLQVQVQLAALHEGHTSVGSRPYPHTIVSLVRRTR